MASRNPPSIIDLLKADHREVEELFEAFEEAEGDARQQAQLASRIGQALTIHAEIEETLFYPTVLNELDTEDADLVCEATVEHGTLRGLIAGMNGGDAAQPMIQAHVAVLKEYVQHHVREEENELFPRVEKLGLDLAALGEQMLELKQELTDEAGGPSPSARGSTIRVADVSARTPVH
ncbi:hemerythrin domain-containing protein [Tahibacter caeni]|uniref:hemerythrin domain-containing protein n=1 Tax=Tahibacter caeni TaxID=1453545 RepID=UPI002149593F|nr:hemerythrin domain-containing protein [Tahibacter caeni]